MQTSKEVIQSVRDGSEHCSYIDMGAFDREVHLDGWFSKEELIAIVYAMGLKEREKLLEQQS